MSQLFIALRITLEYKFQKTVFVHHVFCTSSILLVTFQANVRNTLEIM